MAFGSLSGAAWASPEDDEGARPSRDVFGVNKRALKRENRRHQRNTDRIEKHRLENNKQDANDKGLTREEKLGRMQLNRQVSENAQRRENIRHNRKVRKIRNRNSFGISRRKKSPRRPSATRPARKRPRRPTPAATE
jgi:hypothetical protein